MQISVHPRPNKNFKTWANSGYIKPRCSPQPSTSALIPPSEKSHHATLHCCNLLGARALRSSDRIRWRVQTSSQCFQRRNSRDICYWRKPTSRILHQNRRQIHRFCHYLLQLDLRCAHTTDVTQATRHCYSRAQNRAHARKSVECCNRDSNRFSRRGKPTAHFRHHREILLPVRWYSVQANWRIGFESAAI